MKHIKLTYIALLLLGVIVAVTACGSGGGGGDSSEPAFTFRSGTPSSLSTIRVSVDSSGTQAAGGSSYNAAISSTGRYVVFESDATNLGGTNGLRQIYVHDRDTDNDGTFDESGAVATSLISVNTAGTQAAGGDSYSAAISSTGRYVVFESDATNLGGTNGLKQIYVHDRDADGNGTYDEAGTGKVSTQVASVDSNGTLGNGNSFKSSLSSSGNYVIFESDATNLASVTSNGLRHIYVRIP